MGMLYSLGRKWKVWISGPQLAVPGLLLAPCSGITEEVLGEPYMVPGIEVGPATCWARHMPNALDFQPLRTFPGYRDARRLRPLHPAWSSVGESQWERESAPVCLQPLGNFGNVQRRPNEATGRERLIWQQRSLVKEGTALWQNVMLSRAGPPSQQIMEHLLCSLPGANTSQAGQ